MVLCHSFLYAFNAYLFLFKTLTFLIIPLFCSHIQTYSLCQTSSGYFRENIFLHICASMISGLITTAASMPVDIAKTRNVSETIEHFLLQCPRFHAHRVVLRSQLLTLNVATFDLPTLLAVAGVHPSRNTLSSPVPS
ncbi:Mitochondrial 2-oxoglutarate/malate carrier protein [Chionoecetes opilio]|uniref:Mitochondrial 2-oxoglutarate/malate carrier protein n=1 Tax=Chionoecetes opilio TaxID=41210 RepID=A0A8J4YIA5_CHIOP|nr:Mitochondrial 2-oxoglutarate/malate carrier protein [Chionoecetes opilio]